MLESTGWSHHFNNMLPSLVVVVLLLLPFTLMAKQSQSLGIQDQFCCEDQNGRDPPTRRLQTSERDLQEGRLHRRESNWRAFMSRLPSAAEAEWRDAMSRASVGTTAVMDLGFLNDDGSMGEAFFDGSNHVAMELNNLPLEVDTTVAESNARSVKPQEEKLQDLVACKESMQDVVPVRDDDGERNATEPCLVTVPSHYVRPYKWPLSQFKARVENVAHSPLLRSRHAGAWVRVEASTVVFLAGGPIYPSGAEAYVDHLMQLVPELGFGSATRVALDVECGTASLTRVLAARFGITTLCLAAYTSPDNGVQLVMERGFPGLLTPGLNPGLVPGLDPKGSPSIIPKQQQRLPFPSQAFDMLHCAACNVSWPSHDGILLFEADRILRYGGFFVWMVEVPNQGVSRSDMAIQAEKLCWKLMTRSPQLAVWQKPASMTPAICSNHTQVPLCASTTAIKSESKSWMKPCLESTDVFSIYSNWTWRLRNPPKRLMTVSAGGLQRAKHEVFISDFNYWVYMTDFYIRSLGSLRVAEIRNVLDVNAGFGSFAAALAMRTPPIPWWVLNVVPINQPDRLGVIFDRGLLGIYHDWCKPLDSYARTFDLIHVSRFFAIHQHRCSSLVLLVEMDRLLRPGGFVLIRDHKHVLLPLHRCIVNSAAHLHWKAHLDDTESGTRGTDKLLHCQKTR